MSGIVIDERLIKEISNEATKLYNDTDLTVIEALRVAKEMIMSEEKMKKTY